MGQRNNRTNRGNREPTGNVIPVTWARNNVHRYKRNNKRGNRNNQIKIGATTTTVTKH